jgi:type I restriction enzyme S subunit
MRTKNVQAELDLADVWGIPAPLVRRKDQYLIPGDILVSSANSWNLVGKCCWVPDLPWPATFGGFVSVLRASPAKVDPRYLFRWFASDRIQATVRSFGQQTTNISNLNMERCLKLTLPLPPLAEQQRIAAILDKADALRAKRRASLAQLDALAQSIFLDMFGEPATNPKGLAMSRLGDVADIATGGTPSREEGGYFGGEVPWVKTTEVNGEAICDTEEKLTQAGLRAVRGKLHPAGSLVIAMYGQGKTRGRSARLGIDAAVNQACAVVRPSSKFSSGFMLVQLRLAYERLRSMSRGGNQENLNLELVGSLPVVLPRIEEQAEFDRRITALDDVVARGKASLAQLDTLFTCLQNRAFRGEL